MRYKQEKKESLNRTASSILKVAYDLFLKKGYKNVTTREIAACAGVNLGLISYYFSSKENLGAKVMDYSNKKLYEKAFETKLPEDTGPAEKMCVYTILLWRYTTPELYRLVFELTDSNLSNIRMGETFTDLAWDVIKAYGLSVTPMENEIYLTAFKSSELSLIWKMTNHELNITWDDISDLLLSDYFFNIGLSDQIIYDVLERSKKILNEIS